MLSGKSCPSSHLFLSQACTLTRIAKFCTKHRVKLDVDTRRVCDL